MTEEEDVLQHGNAGGGLVEGDIGNVCTSVLWSKEKR
jgi:hypothetical protein